MENREFDQVYAILEKSFEPFLHRSYEKQKDLLKSTEYNLIIHKENEDILGFLSYWEIDENFIFMEHFAVNPEKRGLGIGEKILTEFLRLDKYKILEVEPPHTEIDKKRIKFYEKFGFILNEREYYQPPYNLYDNKTRLNIMCSKNLQDIEFNNIVEKIYKKVYNVSYVYK